VIAGALVAAATAAAAGAVAIAGLARGWSFFTGRSITAAPVWGWLGDVTIALGAVITVVLAAALVLTAVLGAPRAVLDAVGAQPVSPDGAIAEPGAGPHGATSVTLAARRFANVAGELSLGLGVRPPQLALIADPAPNALSVRRWSRRTLVATSGLLDLPRAEVEAVLAHELAHLHLADARWITAAEASVARARGVTDVIIGVGVLLLTIGFYVDAVWSVIAVGALLVATGTVGRIAAGGAVRRIRAEGDEVADVAAVLLARNPGSLAAVCDRLAADHRRVRRSPARAASAWFKLVPGPDDPGARAGDELRRRAAAAYREARTLPPPVPPLGRG
jgi:Zn-dependent protease with chaperone function